MKELFMIAGLGNPGGRMEKTRHNMGFDTVDLIAEKYGIKVNKLRFKALTGEGEIGGEKVMLIKPQTFMNLSGESLREAVEWHKIPAAKLLVIYDDIDLALGTIRVRQSGSAGSHNGMRSIIFQLKTDSFPRIRVGIGKPPEGWDLADYVLGRFSPADRKLADEAINEAMKAAAVIVAEGAEKAMALFNRKIGPTQIMKG